MAVSWLIFMGVILTTSNYLRLSWDDPPSNRFPSSACLVKVKPIFFLKNRSGGCRLTGCERSLWLGGRGVRKRLVIYT